MGVFAGFALYLVVLAVLALRASRTAGQSDAEYYLAGRSLGPWIVALSAVASGRSAWLLIGMTGLAWHYGVAAVWFLPGYVVAELLLFVGPGRRLRRMTGAAGDVTVGDFFASRFPAWQRSLRLVFAGAVIAFLTAYVSSQLVAGATGMARAFHLGGALGGTRAGQTAGLWATAAVVLAYVVAGGFRAVSWTDVAQVAFMLLALIVLPVTAILHNGGLGPLLDKLASEHSLSPWSAGGPLVVSGLAVGLGSPGNPHILVRYMSVDDERKLIRSALVGTTWNVLMGWGALWIGLAARQATGGFAIVGGRPQGWLHGEFIAKQANIFPAMGEAFLHPLLFGLVMAALLAAIMSTIDSQVLVVASAITRDLRRALGRRPLPDRRAALLGRLTSAALIGGAGILAQLALADQGTSTGVISGLVNQLVLFAWGGLGAAFGPALLLSLYRRRMDGLACLAAMLTGGITACVWKGIVAPAPKSGLFARVWPWISYELTVAFPLALLAGWLVSLRGPKKGLPDLPRPAD